MIEDVVLMALLTFIVQSLIVFVIFVILTKVGKIIYAKLKTNSRIQNAKLLNLEEYLPEEEFTTVKQVFYLAMIIVFVVNILYVLFSFREHSINLLILDVIISLFLVIHDDVGRSRKLLYFLLVPFGSLGVLAFSNIYLVIFDIVHIFPFLYFIKVYYDKFVEYTETNSLGITIMLLFAIIFVSFFVTWIVEGVYPIDAIVMVSNAFTSNGYAVLGTSVPGKLNSLFLVWSGYILSGVATATIATGIVMRYANKKFDHLEELAKRNKKD